MNNQFDMKILLRKNNQILHFLLQHFLLVIHWDNNKLAAHRYT